ncbi:pyruvate,water dikinase [Lipingzhangella halophila]|uniref:Pyruvate,water dikinase n=1 Tax=Lipingzhangella halophila TaxID=1783352 RepID=A0A7W7RCP3_9ACTN|nr:PEP/pyruvate-binding domain-containing protein [Lipingzhangella halophila]MBB4929568.1 pyruvate,water dikinase [Lipingzhangella halophila]
MTPTPPLVLALHDPAAELALVGGKGASLARLAAAGVTVPDGFHVTTEAYARFVEHAGLDAAIRAAVNDAVPDRPETLRRAEERIRELFDGTGIPEKIGGEIREAYSGLGPEPEPVAVRSSATAEDLPEFSFAGQQDTFLNVRGEHNLLEAVRNCWASLWTARAIGYRARNGIGHGDVRLAVVVQRLVPADAAGVLFTADPVTGARDRIVINAGWGLGEAVVGGQVSPDTVVVDRGSGTVVEEQIAEKTVLTTRDANGTHEEPVPAELRGRAVLGPGEAERLARAGSRIEELYGHPVDLEWARDQAEFHILQARPITTAPPEEPPEREVWNDSLTGDYLWTRTNVGEAMPDVMTPITWSLAQLWLRNTWPPAALPEPKLVGNICGRWYINISTMTAFGGGNGTVGSASAQTYGTLPDDVQIPPVPSRKRTIARFLPIAGRALPRLLPHLRRTDEKLAACPDLCERTRARIRATETPEELAALWDSDIAPLIDFIGGVFWAAGRRGGLGIVTLRPWLAKLGVPESDINTLVTGAEDTETAGPMASLGPIIGLSQLAKGEIDRETFARQWGHRAPDEFEVSAPRPAEDPDWIDRQARGMHEALTEVGTLLERRKKERDAALARFAERHPDKVDTLRRRMRGAAAGFRGREAGRSEWARGIWVTREFVLRAGALTGHGDDLFHLETNEILAVLRGDEAPLARVPARRAAYEHYRSLPPPPALIRGRFDPERWAADPNRRSDLYDEHREHTPMSESVTGTPGAAGTVEGTARVVTTAAEGEETLRPGEILVTTVTNVGWTPLFPRAAAVVTDIGAPLSHAAIVARELGIPAVVGCGNATTRLATGDRVRVDGGKGTVETVTATDAGAAAREPSAR